MNKETKESLLETTDMALKCTAWWKNEVASVMEESKEIFEKLDSEDLEWNEKESLQKEADSLLIKMDNLAARGNMEDKNLKNIIKDVNNFYEGQG